MSGSSGVKFSVILGVIQRVTAVAPGDIKPSWELLLSTFTGFVNALRAAGVDPDNITDFSKLTPAQLQALEAQSNQLDSTQVNDATTKIDDEVKSKCGIDLES